MNVPADAIVPNPVMDGNFSYFNDSGPNASAMMNDSSNYYYFHGYGFVIPMAIIMIFLIVVAIGGNVMVILTILRHRGMRTRTNMFIVNLAVADILVAGLDMPISLITIIEGDWIFGDNMCQMNAFTMGLFLICSIHTLMYISFHKYISITRPFSRAMTPRRIKMMIAAAWLWAAFCAMGPLIGWNVNCFKKGASQCGPAVPREFNARSHSLVVTFTVYVVPLGVMCFCYYNIFKEIHVHMRRIRKTSNIDLENSVQQQKKVAITLFLVLACFLLCWTPYIIYSNALAFSKDEKTIPFILNPIAYWCGYVNSACNPIIYAFRSPSFRKGYKEIMCGATSPGLSAVNSMSFRSRSGRGGSLNSPSNNVKVHDPHAFRRQRTMLSQTSWKSLPLFPGLMRTLSKNSAERNSGPESPKDPETPETGCGICGFWRPRPSSHEDERTSSPHGSDSPKDKFHLRLKEIHEEEEENEEASDAVKNPQNAEDDKNPDGEQADRCNEDAGSGNDKVKVHDPHAFRRQRTMLSQTSWSSIPLFPGLMRSLSKNSAERNSGPDSSKNDSESGNDNGKVSVCT